MQYCSSNMAGDECDELLWLQPKKRAEKNQTQQQQLHKVPAMLRRTEAYQNCFDPLVVSIGPYHHGKPQLKFMEEYKVKMANQYVDMKPPSRKYMYNKFKKAAEEARNCYPESSTEKFQCEEFNRMMFIDGCFVIQFIYCLVYKPRNMSMKSNLTACVQRDLLLLENQIPFHVLKELMSFRFEEHQWKKMVRLFIDLILEPPLKYPRQEMIKKNVNDDQKELESEPAHLLQFVRTQLIDKSSLTIPSQGFDNSGWCSFNSAKQLKADGIGFGISKTRQLTDINFTSTFFENVLKLPQIVISNSTKSFLLNMIAYETCPDGPDDLGVSSYVCFMDSLIDDAEDVKELRLNGIISSFLGNDKKIADLFHQIATDLVSNPYAYAEVKDRVEKHYKNNIKVYLRNFFTFIAFCGGISAVVLSVIHTYK